MKLQTTPAAFKAAAARRKRFSHKHMHIPRRLTDRANYNALAGLSRPRLLDYNSVWRLAL
jgi:hypothetical protein